MRFVVIFAIAFLGIIPRAHAFCEPGTVQSCFVNGVEGTQTCDDTAHFGPCIVPGQDPPPSGQCYIRYRILSVIYAPPGRAGGTPSSVNYGSSSTFGTTTSSSHGFKQQYSVQGMTHIGFIFKGDSTVSFGYSRNTVDSSSVDIKKSTSTSIIDPGPAIDGIDHDRDQIWLWLGPTLDVSMPSASAVQWAFNDSAIMNIQFVYVGWLKNPSLIPPGVKNQLDAYGITTADYAEMLQADPFANGPTTINPSRYSALNRTFPYEPPFAPGDPVVTTIYSTSYTTTNTSSATATRDYSVRLTASIGLDVPLFHQSLKTDNTWTWTDTNARSTSGSSTESATVNVTGPSYGYTGPTDIAVYFDNIYRTFMFVPFLPPFAPAVTGVLISDSDAPVAGKEITVVADGVTYTTFTNRLGEFRVYATPKASSMRVRVGNVDMSVARSSTPIAISVP
jgi:hypothetical protein